MSDPGKLLTAGIVSMTFIHLIRAPEKESLTHDVELIEALSELAITERQGGSISANDCRAGLSEGVTRGLLVIVEENLKFRSRHLQELAEAWGVIKHLQPEYVSRARMYDRAIQHLTRIGVGAIPLLVELLGHHETSVANGASVSLAEIGEAAITALHWAITFGNARVRVYALKSLSRMKQTIILDENTLELVSTVLSEDGHAMAKSEAIQVLSNIRHPIAVEALRRALSAAIESTTRSLIVNALESLDTPEARRALDDARREQSSPERSTPQRGWQVAAPHAKAAPKRTPRIFMSYAREDTAAMEEYRRRLQLSGFEVWADSQHLVAGERWEERLRFALNSSDFAVGLLSTATWDGYQRIEVEQAMLLQEDRHEPNAPFFLPLFLSHEEWRSRSDKWPPGLRDLHVIVADRFTTGWTQLYSSLESATHLLGLSVRPRLRAEARMDLTDRDVWRTVFDKDFFSVERNPNGRPLGKADEWDLVLNETLAYDRATELTWTRSPVTQCNLMQAFHVPAALERQVSLPSVRLRLPTLEEAMSIMTPTVDKHGNHRPRDMSGSNYMLTCDTMPARPELDGVTRLVWVADFLTTDVQPVPVESIWPIWLVSS